MALDHLHIGGTVVELAFGILFGGIVLTLALAVGLGSRDLVTRSIEKTMEKPTIVPTERTPDPDPPPQTPPLLTSLLTFMTTDYLPSTTCPTYNLLNAPTRNLRKTHHPLPRHLR